MQQPVGKSRKQICRGKSKLHAEEVPNSGRTPTESFRTKAKLDRHQGKIEQNQWGKVFWPKKQKAYDKSKLVTSLQLITSQKQTHSSQKQITVATRKSNNSYLGSLSIHSEGLDAK